MEGALIKCDCLEGRDHLPLTDPESKAGDIVLCGWCRKPLQLKWASGELIGQRVTILCGPSTCLVVLPGYAMAVSLN